jgi:N4-gp56 family major capsid protein
MTCAGLTGFKSVETYAGRPLCLPGEFGFYGRAGRGVRFIMSEDASIDADAGAATGTDMRGTTPGDTDIYTICLYGQDAFGSVGLGREAHRRRLPRRREHRRFEMIFKERGSGGTSDPFNEISTLGVEGFPCGCGSERELLAALRCGATNLSN